MQDKTIRRITTVKIDRYESGEEDELGKQLSKIQTKWNENNVIENREVNSIRFPNISTADITNESV